MKRTRKEVKEQDEGEGFSDDGSEKEEEKIGKDCEIIDTMGRVRTYVNMPKKAKYRMRAHINPLNVFREAYPPSPEWVDWSLHFPAAFGKLDNNDDKKYVNTKLYPIKYNTIPQLSEDQKKVKVSILDIGCGFGNLVLELSKQFPNDLVFGMEIRDKVTEFVVEKINALRINSGYRKFMNASAIRTNVMKLILNYYEKETFNKMFFCFADPHFKKVNFRRRIINGSLLSEYAYLLKEGGKIYTVTDVKDLYDWNVNFLGNHPLFEEVTGEEKDNDPCVKMMSEMTDEAKKVLRRGLPIWSAVFRKKSGKPSEEAMIKYFM